ncbi:Nucleoside diphosphate kinase [Pseudocohnilembus persalinus]|uniref:Nucleoside diphosphate kinase n=1 Tax=Pseudocohnilembus persalinus TaxID=266149 RepID=A0A0V0R9B5_PSEPJ|nr:Nucleoside diphosphate kinase [Pseudocohnilembus persalinus]|eukprot:KRX11100.1 Nucleoside diphosphate kinase [Pseudocohnilembus persalinus]
MTDLVTDYFNPKCINLSYTIGIIKPDTCMKEQNIQDIVNKIEDEGFIIKNMIQRQLIKEEVLNLYYKHLKQEYIDQIVEYMLSGECCVILMCHETENPIEKWKNMIGHKNPETAKQTDDKCLRAIYGQDLIKNELWGSDSPDDANKERDIFKFTIPQKIPEFHFDKMKISIETLFKFIYPPNQEHPSVNERLDLFALYGPAVNYHSVDQCLCNPCARIGKELLEQVRQEKIVKEKIKLGLSIRNDANLKKFAGSMSTKKAGINKDEKVKVAPIRLLQEEHIQQIYAQFCEKCKFHVDNYAHLTGGRDGQVVLTDQEIKGMGYDLNKEELLDLLTIEKGNAAKNMIQKIPIKEPDNLIYNKELIKILFQELDTDYYERYDFYDIQQMILEDRRIRMTSWISQLVSKPVDRFKNPKLIDPTLTQKQKRNIKNVNFTLERTLPLSMTIKKQEIKNVSTDLPPSIIDKKKLQDNELSIALEQKLHRHTTHTLTIDQLNQQATSRQTVTLIRDNYNEGRHGNWNNYSTFKGMQKGTYVKSKNYPVNHEFQ